MRRKNLVGSYALMTPPAPQNRHHASTRLERTELRHQRLASLNPGEIDHKSRNTAGRVGHASSGQRARDQVDTSDTNSVDCTVPGPTVQRWQA
jgi:hypothetical protein